MRGWPDQGDASDASDASGAFDAVVIACCSVSHSADARRSAPHLGQCVSPAALRRRVDSDVRVPDLATLAEAQGVRPRAFVDLDIDATRQDGGEVGAAAAVHRHDLPAASAARGRAATIRPVRSARAGRAPRDRLRQSRLLSGGTRVVVSVGGLRNRAPVPTTGSRPVDRTSSYVVTVARRPRGRAQAGRPRRSGPRPVARSGNARFDLSGSI